MITFFNVPESGDPSKRIQVFQPLKIDILCCRYWVLENWKSKEMSFPYWRLYWNRTEGGYVYSEKKINLTPDHIILIPPNTIFSSDLETKDKTGKYEKFNLAGARIENAGQEDSFYAQNKVLHLFVHFNLLNQFEFNNYAINKVKLDDYQRNLINEIKAFLLADEDKFSDYISLKTHQLILSSINKLAQGVNKPDHIDPRISDSINYINSNLEKKLTNQNLATRINMATNSFIRLFKKHIQMNPQEYLRFSRISKASSLIDHTMLSIEQISDECGFSDRFHFTKSFKKVKGISPGEYKKRLTLK